MMDSFLWWSGVVTWALFGFVGIMWTIDQSLEWLLSSLGFKREFLCWFAEKLQRKKG